MKEKIIPVYKINFNKYNFTEASLFTVIKDTELVIELEKYINSVIVVDETSSDTHDLPDSIICLM